MDFLIDQDVYSLTIKVLKENGHDVKTAKDIGMHRANDEEILMKAIEMNRILITRDKDFGILVFLEKQTSPGVIFLRISPTTIEDVHIELFRLLREHSEEELKNSFCVIEHQHYRVRKLK